MLKMKTKNPPDDLLWRNISELPYFRGFLRTVEGSYFLDIGLDQPILDLGCGDGHFSSRTFAKINIHLIGIDPDFASLKDASEHQVFDYLICAQGNQLPFPDGLYKTIISNSVLEHISDVNAVILELNRVITTNGRLLITVPNDNFTKNLSIAKYFDAIRFRRIANLYRKLFNKISRHFHTDSQADWIGRLEKTGFSIIDSWNYFTEKSLSILEWGHYFGLPSWINWKLFNHWVLFPSINNPMLRKIYHWLKIHVAKDQKSENGAYSFIIAIKNK